MFTSQSLRAVPKPGSVGFKEHRLDDVVHQIDVAGALEDTAELSRRIEDALAGGVRWLILDLSEAERSPTWCSRASSTPPARCGPARAS